MKVIRGFARAADFVLALFEFYRNGEKYQLLVSTSKVFSEGTLFLVCENNAGILNIIAVLVYEHVHTHAVCKVRKHQRKGTHFTTAILP